jgi:hypothetical protein
VSPYRARIGRLRGRGARRLNSATVRPNLKELHYTIRSLSDLTLKSPALVYRRIKWRPAPKARDSRRQAMSDCGLGVLARAATVGHGNKTRRR